MSDTHTHGKIEYRKAVRADVVNCLWCDFKIEFHFQFNCWSHLSVDTIVCNSGIYMARCGIYGIKCWQYCMQPILQIHCHSFAMLSNKFPYSIIIIRFFIFNIFVGLWILLTDHGKHSICDDRLKGLFRTNQFCCLAFSLISLLANNKTTYSPIKSSRCAANKMGKS